MQTLLRNSFVGQTIDDICKRRLTSVHYGCATAIPELLMIKRGVLDVSECHFNDHESRLYCMSWLILFVLRNYVTFYFLSVICALCTMFILINLNGYVTHML